ncbi:Isoflavone-7-O-methyltransferase 6 [Medicago truncatula]|uniref:isoflavone 7-O-methyltransferase n=2 Tax=Medicago truncatula TaxID=3880 RepID=Q06YR3_MEDTR|nr:isoflavone-7-O-methyltransferase 9 [Medicago truncatula]2QYO_A Chain A, O-methyltransferase [Medicago truncatula]2QYO_B Chain B, O-methyltransferase [Medicago truncatula]ABD83943.1 IOMT 3 [Medicago truncatula]AES77702.1 isoflavone-7-O-methyltransferase [Medicago truncatula]RHN44409.1 Isoflavone-7-O-methyltransferase 6 [Medicago truncatula]
MASSINNRKPSEIFKAQALLYKNMYAFVDSMSLKWSIEMNIPNIIHNHGKPITLSNLVSILQIPSTKVDNVQRLMRYLAHNGFFEIITNQELENEEEAYALTVASELLVKGTELCLAPMVECVLDPTLSTSFHNLKKWVYEEDLTLFAVNLGCDLWEFLNKNPEYNTLYNDALASDSKMINLAMKDCNLVFEGLESIVDVGGGNGTTGKIICETFPKLTCVVFDRPKVVENLCGSNNLTYVGGDMFISVPKADAVLLKAVLHDWTDKDCIKILKKCKEAVTSDGKRGKVIVIDMVINEKKDENQLTQIKLLMNVTISCVNGKERNEEEWKKLFIEAGFQDYKISPFTGLMSLIEIYP